MSMLTLEAKYLLRNKTWKYWPSPADSLRLILSTGGPVPNKWEFELRRSSQVKSVLLGLYEMYQYITHAGGIRWLAEETNLNKAKCIQDLCSQTQKVWKIYCMTFFWCSRLVLLYLKFFYCLSISVISQNGKIDTLRERRVIVLWERVHLLLLVKKQDPLPAEMAFMSRQSNLKKHWKRV